MLSNGSRRNLEVFVSDEPLCFRKGRIEGQSLLIKTLQTEGLEHRLDLTQSPRPQGLAFLVLDGTM